MHTLYKPINILTEYGMYIGNYVEKSFEPLLFFGRIMEEHLLLKNQIFK